jgi:hypothetical protein
MKRRDFVQRLGIGSTVIAAGAALGHSAAVRDAEAQGHDHAQVDGPLASATVSFGQWIAGTIDRIAEPNPRTLNQHLLVPYMPTIKAGGSVNFIIAGFHHVVAYAPGTTTAHINTAARVRPQQPTPPPPVPPGAPDLYFLINDPLNRVYRGLDPSLLPQDRVEVVTFREPGTYLVICGFLPHFLIDNMHGFVRVIR